MQALAAVFCSLALGISASAAALGDADPEAEGEPPPLISSRDLTAILGNCVQSYLGDACVLRSHHRAT